MGVGIAHIGGYESGNNNHGAESGVRDTQDRELASDKSNPAEEEV
jgi:hypothetical protein